MSGEGLGGSGGTSPGLWEKPERGPGYLMVRCSGRAHFLNIKIGGELGKRLPWAARVRCKLPRARGGGKKNTFPFPLPAPQNQMRCRLPQSAHTSLPMTLKRISLHIYRHVGAFLKGQVLFLSACPAQCLAHR